jgi:hypothetical protein
MFSKSSFSSFSLEHSDRNHFLRPDRILGAFQFYRNKKIEFNKDRAFLLSEEIKFEKKLSEPLGAAELSTQKNLSRVRHAFEELWQKVPNNLLEGYAEPEQFSTRNGFQRRMSHLFRHLVAEAQEDDDSLDTDEDTIGVDEELSLPSMKTNSFNEGNGGVGVGGDVDDAKCIEMVTTSTAALQNASMWFTRENTSVNTTLPGPVVVPFSKLPNSNLGEFFFYMHNNLL